MPTQDTSNVAVTGSALSLAPRDVHPGRLKPIAQPFVEFDFNTSSMVKDALPQVIEQLGKKDIRIFKYARITGDTFEDVRRVSREIWGGQRSFFLPEPQSGETEEKVEIDLILHLGKVARPIPLRDSGTPRWLRTARGRRPIR